jgi:single-strand DNA-binding protein
MAKGGKVSGYNNSVILGRLTGPPEQFTTKNGKLFLKAVIATSVYQKNSDGTSEERTNFVPVTIFGRTAEVFLEHVHKGDLLHLVGRLDSNEWTTGSGKKRLSLSFVVEQLNLLPNGQGVKPKPSTEPARSVGHQPSPAPTRSSAGAPSKPEVDENGDPVEIPF